MVSNEELLRSQWAALRRWIETSGVLQHSQEQSANGAIALTSITSAASAGSTSGSSSTQLFRGRGSRGRPAAS